MLIPEFFGSRVRFFSSPGSDPVNPDPDPKPSTVLMWIRGFHREKIYQYLWWIRDVDTYVSPSIWIRIKTEVASIIQIIVFYDSMNPDPCECQNSDTKKNEYILWDSSSHISFYLLANTIKKTWCRRINVKKNAIYILKKIKENGCS